MVCEIEDDDTVVPLYAQVMKTRSGQIEGGKKTVRELNMQF